MLKLYRKWQPTQGRRVKRGQFVVRARVPETSMTIVRYYTTRRDDDMLRLKKFKMEQLSSLEVEQHLTPEEEGLFAKAAQKLGLRVVPQWVALMFGYDMSDPHAPDCPPMSVPDPESMERLIKGLGGHHPGARISCVALPRQRAQHFYLYIGHVAKVSELATRTGQSPEAIRAALGDPLIFFVLWMCSVMTGGVTADLENLDNLFEGGWIRALVTEDPVKLSGFRREEIERTTLIVFLAQVLYGHALKGSAQHHFSIIGDDVVYVVAGAGRQRLSVGALANIWVACAPHSGMWWETSSHMSRALNDPTVMNGLCEVSRSGDPREVMQQMVSSKRPDSFWAWLRMYAGHVVRVPSRLYNTLSGGDPDTVKTRSTTSDKSKHPS